MNAARLTLQLALAGGFFLAHAAAATARPDATMVAEERALIALVQSADSTPNQKQLACQRLAIIGTKEAVPALATLLADERFAHLARHALEPMPEPAAGEALRDALRRTNGRLLVGVINSLGARREPAAIDAIAARLADADPEVATAAATALGRIGTVEAARRLQAALGSADGSRRRVLLDACLGCAEQLVAARQHSDAVALYDRLCETSFPAPVRGAALVGAITARGSDGTARLLQQIKGDDPVMLAAAWRAARELPGPAVTRALAAELPHLAAERQASLLEVLGARGDPAALAAVLAAARSESADVRVAAWQVLPRLDDGGGSLSILLPAILRSPNAAELDAALVCLGHIGGTGTNAEILAALGAAAPAIRARLIAVLAVRRAEGARGELLRQAASGEAEVAKAAFRALARLGQPADLPQLITLSLACRDDAVRVPADLAVFAVAMKREPAADRADPILAALRSAQEPTARGSLLRPLGAIVKAMGSCPRAFAVVNGMLDDPEPTVRDAALRTLADWPDAAPASRLLQVAEREPAHREVALRGGVRMAANVAAGRDATSLDALAWFTRANQLVATKSEKLILVSGLGSVKRIEAFQILQPYLDDPAVQAEAALALLELAPGLSGSSGAAPAKRALERMAQEAKDADVRRKAANVAKKL